jgi:hypothetical protein
MRTKITQSENGRCHSVSVRHHVLSSAIDRKKNMMRSYSFESDRKEKRPCIRSESDAGTVSPDRLECRFYFTVCQIFTAGYFLNHRKKSFFRPGVSGSQTY